MTEHRARPTDDDLRALAACWRAAEYLLSAERIYLMGSPLPCEPRTVDHVQPRLPGH